MKKTLIGLLALLVCGAGWAAQDTTITIREVRNPNDLKAYLEANATDAESRLVSNATNSNQIILTTVTDADTARIYMQADKADDAGDKFGIVATDGSGLAIQSDAAVKGTLATKVTISGAGGIAAADAVTLTDADGHAVISAIAASGAYDASIVLDADAGEDNADTYTIKATSANVLSFMNHTTEIMALTTAGALSVDAGFAAGDAVTLTDADGNATLSAIAASGAYHAELVLDADAGEDNADTWTIRAQDDAANALAVLNHTTEVLTLSTAGALAVDAGVTAGDAITLTDADGAAVITATGATGDNDARLILDSDAGEDDTDTWTFEADGAAGNTLTIYNHTTARMTISAAGAVAIPGTLTTTGAGVFSTNISAVVMSAVNSDVTGTNYVKGVSHLVGAVTMDATLGVTGVGTFSTNGTFGGSMSVGTTLAVAEDATLAADAYVNGGSLVVSNTGNAAGTIWIVGDEADEAALYLDADQGDDNADTFSIHATAANSLEFNNHATKIFDLTSAGAGTFASTAQATGFKIGAISGFGGSFTNYFEGANGYTQTLYYAGGLLTNVVHVGPNIL